METHKRDVLQGLTCLKRPHLKSYATVLDALYHIFKQKGNLLVLEQVCVLLTGMGLANVYGRMAFCQVVNTYCATVFQLCYFEIDQCQLPLRIKHMYYPTYGRQITEPRFHQSRFNKDQTQYICWRVGD